jgi:hypothetical protein
MKQDAAMRATILERYRMTTLMALQDRRMCTIKDAFKVQIGMVNKGKQFDRDTLREMAMWMREKLGEDKKEEWPIAEEKGENSEMKGLDEMEWVDGVVERVEGMETGIEKEMNELVDRYFKDVEKMDEGLQMVRITELDTFFFNDAGVRQILTEGERWLMTHSNGC